MGRVTHPGIGPQSIIAAAALAVALVIGGGGSPSPLSELAVQLVFALLACVAVVLPGPRALAPRIVTMLCALMLAVPIVQLVPLPATLWQALPGRQAARDSLALIGADSGWHTWALAPSRTLASLLALLPPTWLLVQVSRLPSTGRLLLPFVVLVVALLTLVAGAGQLSQGLGGPMRFYEPDSFYLDGFQANHNSTADVLLIGLVAACAALRLAAERGYLPDRRVVVLSLAGSALVLLGIGIILTGSRMGIVLVPLALAGCLRILRPWIALSRRTVLIGVAALAATGALLPLVAARSVAVANVLQRFDFTGEGRPGLWADALFAAQTNFPFGTGVGNFIPAMLAGERLEIVTQTLPNRAHNEVLELAVEGGLFLLAAWAAIAAIAIALAWRARRARSGPDVTLAIFAETALALLVVHSMVDYPFRSMSLACLGAACLALLVPAASSHHRTTERAKGSHDQ